MTLLERRQKFKRKKRFLKVQPSPSTVLTGTTCITPRSLSPTDGQRANRPLKPSKDVKLSLADATKVIKQDGGISFNVSVEHLSAKNEAGTLPVVVAGKNFRK